MNVLVLHLRKHIKKVFLYYVLLIVLEFGCWEDATMPPGSPNYPDIDCCPSWSPDGTQILYSHRGIVSISEYGSYSVNPDSVGLWIVDTLGTNTKMLVHGDVFYARWSPDGNWLLFESGAQIYKVGVENDSILHDTMQQLTFDGRNYFPSWNPNGEWIAYDNMNCGSGDHPPQDACGILIMRNDGTNRRYIAKGRMPDWSPDGNYLVYIGMDDHEVYRVSINNQSQVERITDFNKDLITMTIRRPKYSPDGNSIAFQTTSNGIESIWIMKSDGSNMQRLISGANPSWAPDGLSIVSNYSPRGSINDKGTVWILRIEDLELRQLTRGPG